MGIDIVVGGLVVQFLSEVFPKFFRKSTESLVYRIAIRKSFTRSTLNVHVQLLNRAIPIISAQIQQVRSEEGTHDDG